MSSQDRTSCGPWRAVCWCGWKAEVACRDREMAYRVAEHHVSVNRVPGCTEYEGAIVYDGPRDLYS